MDTFCSLLTEHWQWGGHSLTHKSGAHDLGVGVVHSPAAARKCQFGNRTTEDDMMTSLCSRDCEGNPDHYCRQQRRRQRRLRRGPSSASRSLLRKRRRRQLQRCCLRPDQSWCQTAADAVNWQLFLECVQGGAGHFSLKTRSPMFSRRCRDTQLHSFMCSQKAPWPSSKVDETPSLPEEEAAAAAAAALPPEAAAAAAAGNPYITIVCDDCGCGCRTMKPCCLPPCCCWLWFPAGNMSCCQKLAKQLHSSASTKQLHSSALTMRRSI